MQTCHKTAVFCVNNARQVCENVKKYLNKPQKSRNKLNKYAKMLQKCGILCDKCSNSARTSRTLFEKTTTTKKKVEKLCKTAEEVPVNSKFKLIKDGTGNHILPADVAKDLSNDQRYLYEITNAIRKGEISSKMGYPKTNYSPLWFQIKCEPTRMHLATHSRRFNYLSCFRRPHISSSSLI